MRNLKKVLLIGLILIIAVISIKLTFFSVPFRYAGTLEATKVDLSARLPAAISDITVWEGDSVHRGEILIRLTCEDYKIAATLAHQNYDRYLPLVKKGWASPDVLDKYQKEMEDADTKVTWCTIASPIDGKVLSRYHEPGEWMEPGTKILTLANVQDIWAYIYVPQTEVAKLSYGMKLTGYIPELKDRVFEGRIIKISDEAEFTPKNVQTREERQRLIYGIKVSFLAVNQNEILKPGMTVEIELPRGGDKQTVQEKVQRKVQGKVQEFLKSLIDPKIDSKVAPKDPNNQEEHKQKNDKNDKNNPSEQKAQKKYNESKNKP